MKKLRWHRVSLLVAAVLFILVNVAGCTTATFDPVPTLSQSTSTPAVIADVAVTFSAQIPIEPVSPRMVYLELLTDPFASGTQVQRFPMEKSDDHVWVTRLDLIRNSLTRYRYVCETEQGEQIEHSPAGRSVSFRRYFAESPGEVTDIIAAWDANGSDLPTGQILGTVTDASNTPLPDMLVTAGGLSTISSADGSFQLQGLQTGLHNLVITSIHGEAQPFQQGAVIEPHAITPAPVVVRRSEYINATFLLEDAGDPPQGSSIRLIGNLYETGNIFSCLKDETCVDPIQSPVLSEIDDGRYAITISLPVGFDFRYQYTLGDNYWNTELNADGEPKTRQIMVPPEEAVISDEIDRWYPDGNQAIRFEVSVPDETPATVTLSIQFYNEEWKPPLPMQRTGVNQWVFTLIHPFPSAEEVLYRYCRNQLCTAAPVSAVNGGPAEQTLSLPAETQIVQDTVDAWRWLPSSSEQTTIIGTPVQRRESAFMAGIELNTVVRDGTFNAYTAAFSNIQSTGANWLILTPTWHYTSLNPPRLEMVPGEDIFARDLKEIIMQAQQNGLQVALYPQIVLDGDEQSWWTSAVRDGAWWQAWFDQVQAFFVHFAWIAQENGVQAIILGGPDVSPSYPQGRSPSGRTSDVFADSEQRWSALVADMRALYQGELLFAIENTTEYSFSVDYLQQFDRMYVLVDTPLTIDDTQEEELTNSIETYLEEQVLPFSETVQRDVILALNYPSHPDAVNGCIRTADKCIDFEILASSNFEEQEKQQSEILAASGTPDFAIQYKIYESFLNAVNDKNWISGFVSRGYDATAERHDFSASVRGKPAAALLWYWFPGFVSSEQ